MGDEGDGVMHGTPEEAHEVSDNLFKISTITYIQQYLNRVLNSLKLV